jgi:phage FluMu protein Com
MAQILPFPARKDPYLTGEARCLHCGHIYVAVSPVGTVEELECPQCGLFKSIYQGLTEPPKGVRWVCACGGDLFYIVPADGCQCLKCGRIQSGF